MFDFHMHTTVSYDGRSTAQAMVEAAAAAGLKEICFTDHMDYRHCRPRSEITYCVETYNSAYDGLQMPGLLIRNGVEIGMTTWNLEETQRDLQLRHYDFVIGSVHYLEDRDIYDDEAYWAEHTQEQVERKYFEELLACAQCHDNFDVLGHLTYVSKTPANPRRRIIPLSDYQEVVDEIFKTLAAKGKGIEVNTSGMDRFGDYLPGAQYLRRFRELGGEIVTVGSDAHNTDRVGQYTFEVCTMLKDIFGYVCTFADRKPIFHKL